MHIINKTYACCLSDPLTTTNELWRDHVIQLSHFTVEETEAQWGAVAQQGWGPGWTLLLQASTCFTTPQWLDSAGHLYLLTLSQWDLSLCGISKRHHFGGRLALLPFKHLEGISPPLSIFPSHSWLYLLPLFPCQLCCFSSSRHFLIPTIVSSLLSYRARNCSSFSWAPALGS